MKNTKKTTLFSGAVSRLTVIIVLIMFFNSKSIAQSLTLQCAWQSPDSSVPVQYAQEKYTVIQHANKEYEVMRIHNTCYATSYMEPILPAGAGSYMYYPAHISIGHDDSLVVLMQTDSSIVDAHKIQGILGELTLHHPYTPGSTNNLIQSCRNGKGLTYLLSYEQGGSKWLRLGTAKYAAIAPPGSPFSGFSSTNYVYCSDVNYHYIIGADSSTAYMMVRTNDAAQTLVNTYPIALLSGGCTFTDYWQTDTTITVMYVPVGMNKVVKKTIMKSNGVFQDASIDHNVITLIDNDAGKMIADNITQFGNVLIKHVPGLVGSLPIIDSSLFLPSSYAAPYTAQSQGHTLWVGNLWDTVSQTSNIKVLLARNSDLYRADSLIIATGATNFAKGVQMENDSILTIWGVTNTLPLAASAQKGAHAAVWRIKVTYAPLGVVETVKENFRLAYPNPVTTTLFIPSPDPYTIINSVGQIVSEGKNSVQHIRQIDCSSWPPGVYSLLLDNKNIKVLKQ